MYKVGQRVKLPAIPSQDIPDEFGTIIEVQENNGCIVVEVDDAYSLCDDRLREVPMDNTIIIEVGDDRLE